MSIRWKTFLPLAILSILLIGYLYASWIPRSVENIETEYRHSLGRHLDSIAEGLIPLLLGHQLDAVYEDLNVLMRRNKDWLDIRLIDADGRIEYPLNAPGAIPENLEGQDIHVLVHRIRYLDRDLGTIRLAVDFAPMLADVKKHHQVLLVSLLMMLAGYVVVVGFIVERIVRKPVTTLSRASEQLAQGVFDAPLPPAGKDEVGVLVTSFKSMRDDIGTYQAELVRRNREIVQLSHAVEQSPVSIVITDIDARIVFVNPRFTQLTGYAAKEVLGKNPRLLQSGMTPRSEYERLWNTITAGNVWTGEFCNKKKNGDLYWESASLSAIQDENGVTTNYLAVKEDITERKRTEEALRNREIELNESQRLAHIGSWEWNAVDDAIWWSDEYYRIYGLDPGKPTPNYAEHLTTYTADSAKRLDDAVKRAMETGEPYELDLELAEPTASTRWIVARGEAKRDETEKICGLRGTAQNITERKLTEDRLKQAGSYNRSLIEASLDPLVTIDVNGKITDVNAATEAVTGCEREELIGTDFSDYFTEPDKARAGYQRVFRDGTVHDYALELRHRDGHVTSVLYNASVYRDDTGAVLGVFAAARDVTDRRKAEAEIRALNDELEERVRQRTSDLDRKTSELAESQRALMNIVEDLNQKTAELERANTKLKELDRLKSMFIASMSHELRTPLNSIIGFSSILLDEWLGPLTAEQKENMGSILRSGRHLLLLINDVIDVSKIEAGVAESVNEDFDLHGVVTEVVASLAKEAVEKSVVLSADAVHLTVHSDRRRLLQCLLNLVSNAVKFTERGSVHVTAARAHDRPDAVEIVVADTGIGMKEEDLPKLFNAFVRLDSPLRSKIPGTGLGLYLTKKLATGVLNGTLRVTSRERAGSTFTMMIPITNT